MKWREFKEAVAEELPRSPRYSLGNGDDRSRKGRMMFRGHQDASWELSTTLERYLQDDVTLEYYAKTCLSAGRYLGGLVQNHPEYNEWENTNCEPHVSFPNYELSVFLRHHGFPSPLLDWSQSPYVAVYFALVDQPNVQTDAAILGYRSWEAFESEGYLKVDNSIWSLGPWVRAHERHIAQQCEYTCCLSRDQDSKFGSHQKIFDAALQGDPSSPNHFKWVIDANQRAEAMADLFAMNITPFSLFRTNDAAAKTVALKLYGIPKK